MQKEPRMLENKPSEFGHASRFAMVIRLEIITANLSCWESRTGLPVLIVSFNDYMDIL